MRLAKRLGRCVCGPRAPGLRLCDFGSQVHAALLLAVEGVGVWCIEAMIPRETVESKAAFRPAKVSDYRLAITTFASVRRRARQMTLDSTHSQVADGRKKTATHSALGRGCAV